MENLVTVDFLDPSKTLLLYNDFKLHKHKDNNDGASRWRCQTCKSISITINKDYRVIREPEPDARHNERKC